MQIGSFEITLKRKAEEKEDKKLDRAVSFAESSGDTDGAVNVYTQSGFLNWQINLDDILRNDAETITRYRNMAVHPEIDTVVDQIANESIITGENKSAVEINLDNIDTSDKIKDKVREEFDGVLKLLKFKKRGTDLFKQWYVDSRLIYHKVVDAKREHEGIVDLRQIDPRNITKVREVEKGITEEGIEIVKDIHEYFLFKNIYIDQRSTGLNLQFPTASHHVQSISDGSNNQAVKISPEAITHVVSGLTDPERKNVLGYLHKAIKPLNQLRMIEDAIVIYRITRAPERRIFNVDVGNMPKADAEEYMRQLIQKYRNKVTYDVASGNVTDASRHIAMMEDFWVPKYSDGRGTTIDTMSGGENLGELADLMFFQKKLYRSLHVPISRLEIEGGGIINVGRAADITRDELNFAKFIAGLRNKFSELFLDILETQVVLKKIATQEEWNDWKEEIFFDFLQDTYLTESKDAELFTSRLGLMRDITDYVGEYVSKEYVYKNVLRMSDDEIEEEKERIKKEQSEGEIPSEDDLKAVDGKFGAAEAQDRNREMEDQRFDKEMNPEDDEDDEDEKSEVAKKDEAVKSGTEPSKADKDNEKEQEEREKRKDKNKSDNSRNDKS